MWPLIVILHLTSFLWILFTTICVISSSTSKLIQVTLPVQRSKIGLACLSLNMITTVGLGILMQALVTFAQITVYYQKGQQLLASRTLSASSVNYTGTTAYNLTVLNPPAPPNPAITTNFAIQLQNGGTPGASIQQMGSFFGFSIETSVVDQVCEQFLHFRSFVDVLAFHSVGKNLFVNFVVRRPMSWQSFRTVLQVPFLNLMVNLTQHVGQVNIQVRGNTQETAVLIPSTLDGKIFKKDNAGSTNPVHPLNSLSLFSFNHSLRHKHHH